MDVAQPMSRLDKSEWKDRLAALHFLQANMAPSSIQRFIQTYSPRPRSRSPNITILALHAAAHRLRCNNLCNELLNCCASRSFIFLADGLACRDDDDDDALDPAADAGEASRRLRSRSSFFVSAEAAEVSVSLLLRRRRVGDVCAAVPAVAVTLTFAAP